MIELFLRLHDANNNVVRVNMSLIESYGVINKQTYAEDDDGSVPGEGFTCLVPSGITETEPCYVVRETPLEIDNMLETASYRNVCIYGSAT